VSRRFFFAIISTATAFCTRPTMKRSWSASRGRGDLDDDHLAEFYKAWDAMHPL